MAVSWPSGVNNRFYGLSSGAEENYIEVQFESGKKRRFKKNSTTPRTHSFNFLLHNKAEENAFWTWYTTDLAGGAESFSMPSILDSTVTQEYLMASTPSVEGGQYPRTVTLEVVEA